jgi:citrate synthase
MNKEMTEQTDSLESIISEVTKLNELVYAGYSIESLSRDVTTDNIEDICVLLNRLSQSTDRNTKVYILSTGSGQ